MNIWAKASIILSISALIMIRLGSGGFTPAVLTDEISSSDHTKGNIEAEVILIEYSDFQCPACSYYAQMAKDISAEFGDHMVFAYRHLPLESIHDNAKPAAYAAEAAGEQDKFWEMHDLLFEKQSQWSSQLNEEEIFEDYAEELGLDIDKFKKSYTSRAVQNKVQNDQDSATEMGIHGTPTFFLNGQQIQNPRTHDAFRKLIREAIN